MDENDPMRKRLKNAEDQWGIRSEVARVWGPTFDKLLELYNTHDLKTIMSRLKPGNKDQYRLDKKLPISELKSWMTPEFEPSIWKKYVCKKTYEHEEKMGQNKFTALFGEQADGPTGRKDDGMTKDQFISGIMEEIRSKAGDKEVWNMMVCFVAFEDTVYHLLRLTLPFSGSNFTQRCLPTFGTCRILQAVATSNAFYLYFAGTNCSLRVSQVLLFFLLW